MRLFERKNSREERRGRGGSMDGHHISNRWPVKKAKSLGQKVLPILAGLSLFMQLEWDENTSPPINGCLRKAPKYIGSVALL